MYPFSTPWKHQNTVTAFWCFQRVDKGCIGKERVTYSWIFRGVRAIDFITIPRSINYGYTVKTNNKIEDCWSRDFNVSEDGLGLALLFVFDFSRKMFFLSYSISWPNFIDWFPSLLEILENMCIVIICYPVIICCILLGNMIIVIICFPLDDIINFKTNVGFLIKPFSHVNENVNTKI